jgi:hypothetical protein
MIVRLNKVESSVLLLHMATMRNNVKKGFKKTHGSKEGKELLSRYDRVKGDLEKEIENTTIEEMEAAELQKETDFHFNINEFDMIFTFVKWYKEKLQETFDKAEKTSNTWKISETDKGQLQTLAQIGNKMEEAKLNYA